MRQGVVFEFGVELIDDGVAAVDAVGVDCGRAGVGGEGVVPPDVGQAVLAGRVEPFDPSDDEPAVDAAGFLLRGGQVKGISATSASEIQRCSSSSQTAWGYLIGVQSSLLTTTAFSGGSRYKPHGAVTLFSNLGPWGNTV
jgi:hypothetical protein